jgi:hypothetical protein
LVEHKKITLETAGEAIPRTQEDSRKRLRQRRHPRQGLRRGSEVLDNTRKKRLQRGEGEDRRPKK